MFNIHEAVVRFRLMMSSLKIVPQDSIFCYYNDPILEPIEIINSDLSAQTSIHSQYEYRSLFINVSLGIIQLDGGLVNAVPEQEIGM